jgi:hypothetical protein
LFKGTREFEISQSLLISLLDVDGDEKPASVPLKAGLLEAALLDILGEEWTVILHEDRWFGRPTSFWDERIRRDGRLRRRDQEQSHETKP